MAAAASSTQRDGRRDDSSDTDECCSTEHVNVLDSYFRDQGWDPTNESKEDFLMNQWISVAMKASASGNAVNRNSSSIMLDQDDADSSSASSKNKKLPSPTSCIKLVWHEDEGGNELDAQTAEAAAPTSILLRTSTLYGQALDSIPEDHSCASSSSTTGASRELKLKFQLKDEHEEGSSIEMRETDFIDASLDGDNETVDTSGIDETKVDDPEETISLDWLLQTEWAGADPPVKKDHCYSLVSHQQEETTSSNASVNNEAVDEFHGNSTSVSALIARMHLQAKPNDVTENVITDQSAKLRWLFGSSACLCLGLLLYFLFAATKQLEPAMFSESHQNLTVISVDESLELRLRIIDYYETGV